MLKRFRNTVNNENGHIVMEVYYIMFLTPVIGLLLALFMKATGRVVTEDSFTTLAIASYTAAAVIVMAIATVRLIHKKRRNTK